MRKMMIMSACAAALAGPSHAFDFGADIIGDVKDRSAEAERVKSGKGESSPSERNDATPADSGRSLALPDTMTMTAEEREAEARRAARKAAEQARLERLTRPDGDLPDLSAQIALASFFDEKPETRLTPDAVVAWYAVGSGETCRKVKQMDEFEKRELVQSASSEIRVHDTSTMGPFELRLPEYDFGASAFPFSASDLGNNVSFRVQPETPRGCRGFLDDLIQRRVTAHVTDGLIDLPMTVEAAKSLSAELENGQLFYEVAMTYEGAEAKKYRGNELSYSIDRIHFYSALDDQNQLEGYLMSYDLEAEAWVKGTGEVLDDGTVERDYERVYPPAE